MIAILPILFPVRILITEPKRVIASHLTKLLRGWGHEVIYCGHDGGKLLAQVAHHPPDLILTGFHLQGSMNSFEMLSRLWARWDIPVVLLSGAVPIDLPPAWQQQASLFFLAKPFLPYQLHLVIEEVKARAHENRGHGPTR